MRISDWSPDVCSSDLAFVQAEFAADHLVLRQSVSVDVDTFDIDAGGILHLEGKPHGEIVFIASEFGIDLRKSITEKPRRFRHGRDGVFDLLGVVLVPFLHWAKSPSSIVSQDRKCFG